MKKQTGLAVSIQPESSRRLQAERIVLARFKAEARKRSANGGGRLVISQVGGRCRIVEDR